MTPGISEYLLIGGVAAIVTFAATPIVGLIARDRGWVVAPNERSVHTSPIPHVGGLAMLTGFLVALVAAWSIGAFETDLREQLRTARVS